MSLTTEQTTFASGLGKALDRQLTGVVTTCFWYGMFMLLMLISAVLHVQRKTVEAKFAHHVLFGATVASFIISTVYVTARLAVVYMLMDNILATASHKTLLKFELELLTSVDVVIDWAAIIPTLIIDGTIIWGAWALCKAWFPSEKWAITFPCLLWVGTFATTFAYVIWLSTPSGFKLYIHTPPTALNDLLIAGVALSNSTNLSATMLFGWTLWQLRSGLGTQPTAVKTFMAFLIESGTVYFTIQLVYLGFLVKAPSGTVALYFWIFFAPTYTMFSAMYPTVIMVLKALRPSSDAVVAGFRLSKIPTLNMMSVEVEPAQHDHGDVHAHSGLPPQDSASLGVSFVAASHNV